MHVFPNHVAVVHVLASSAHHAFQVSSLSRPTNVEVPESPPRSLLKRVQDAAHKVGVEASITSSLKRRASNASNVKPEDDKKPALQTVVSLKDMSTRWKLVRNAVKLGAAVRSNRTETLSRESYQFLLQSDRNPKFSRLEAKKSFLMLDEDVPLELATVSQYEGFDHIIFCCKCEGHGVSLGGSLKRFVAPLRSKSSLFVRTPIVLLASKLGVKDFESVAMYPSVFVVIGNPLLMPDLRRAGIMSAKYAVVSSQFLPRAREFVSDRDDATSADTAAMFAGNMMKKMNSACCVVVELHYSRSVRFIGVSPAENHEIGVATASGRYFSIQYFHVLMCRCFFSPYCLPLLQEFLRPHPVFTPDTQRDAVFSSSVMTTLLVPQRFCGCTFGQFFHTCAAIAIPIAIYRAAASSNAAKERYLVSCPAFDMRLQVDDQFILLSPLPPKILISALATVSDFASGMQFHANTKDNWQKVYDTVDPSTHDDANSVSSESLLVQVGNENYMLQ
jgi:hypothetical protein